MTKPENALKRLCQLRNMQNTLHAKILVRADQGLPSQTLQHRLSVLSWSFAELCEKYHYTTDQIDDELYSFNNRSRDRQYRTA